VLISAYSLSKVVAFEMDPDGLPITSTARDRVIGLSGAEGAWIDPVTGNFLFSTFGGTNRVVRVSGFALPTTLAEPAQPMNTRSVSPDPTDGLLRLGFDATHPIDAVNVIAAHGRLVLRLSRPVDHMIDRAPLPASLYTVLAFTKECVISARAVRE
jgi:hypothetical protein